MRRALPFLWLVVAFGSQFPGQMTWPQFRGPRSSGIAATARDLPTNFGPDRHVAWRAPVPAGHASPIGWGPHVFLTGHVDGAFETLCLDRATGRVRWRRRHPVAKLEKLHRINSAASSTPVTDGERVYAYFGSFGLVCYDVSGQLQWTFRVPLPKNTFGTAASPILVGDRVILARDTDADSYLIALDKKTGKPAWKRDRSGFRSAWSTPVLWSHAGEDELLVYGAFRLTAYDPKTGRERWSVPGLADEPCITPVTGKGLVFITSYNMRTNPEVIGLPKFDVLLSQYDADENGRLSRSEVKDNKSILSRSDADGEGDHPLRGFFRFLDRDRSGELDKKEWQRMFAWLNTFKHLNALIAIRPGDGKDRGAEIAWQHARGVPECPSPLYYDGRVYLVKNGGMVTCVAATDGSVAFEGRLGARGPYYASPIVADDKIYAASARGVITVLAPGPKLRILARNSLDARIMATPAAVGRHLYVRTDQHLYAFAKPE